MNDEEQKAEEKLNAYISEHAERLHSELILPSQQVTARVVGVLLEESRERGLNVAALIPCVTGMLVGFMKEGPQDWKQEVSYKLGESVGREFEKERQKELKGE